MSVGLDIKDVLQIHCVGAAVCGTIAVLYPPFFGAVFSNLDNETGITVTARLYCVLMMAQVVVLVGIRSSPSTTLARRVSFIYGLVFTLSAGIALRDQFLLHNSTGLSKYLWMVWLSLAAPYLLLSIVGTRSLIHAFSYVHSFFAVVVSLAGIAFTGQLSRFLFGAQLQTENFNSISQYYGVLICGMSLLTSTLAEKHTDPARPAARIAFAAMFGASAVLLLAAAVGGSAQLISATNWMTIFAGISSVILFVVLSILYATASMDKSVPAVQEPLVGERPGSDVAISGGAAK